jgi:hypothetical protein
MPSHQGCEQVLDDLAIDATMEAGRLTLHRRGLQVRYTARYFTDVVFPDLDIPIVARVVSQGLAEIRVGAATFQIHQQETSHPSSEILDQ